MPEDLLDRLIRDWRRERPDLDASAMGCVGRILRIGRLLEAQANSALAPYGLHYTDLDVLATLRRSGAPYRLTPTQLRQSVLLTSGAMTVALGRLATAKLIERNADANDGRVRWVILTGRGLLLIDKAIAVRFDQAEKAVAGLVKAERRALERLLRKLALSIDKQAAGQSGLNAAIEAKESKPATARSAGVRRRTPRVIPPKSG